VLSFRYRSLRLYLSERTGEWENGASGCARHHPCTLFISSASFLPSSSEYLGGQTVFFQAWHWDEAFGWSGSRNLSCGQLGSDARFHLHPATLERVPPAIHHSCVNRDFRNVIEAWTRHASLHVSEKRAIIGRFRQSLPPRDLPGVVLHP